MALKVKAVERLVKFNKEDEGTWRYVMSPDLYIALNQSKVIREAALRSGVSQGVMKACWDAAGEVIKAWATEGHSVALPGLGTMRFGLRAKSVEKVEDVKAGLITSRRIIEKNVNHELDYFPGGIMLPCILVMCLREPADDFLKDIAHGHGACGGGMKVHFREGLDQFQGQSRQGRDGNHKREALSCR